MHNKRRPLAQRTISIRPTNPEKLYTLLRDRTWHCTRELVEQVGHTFAAAKFYLVKLGYEIEKRRKPGAQRLWQYRMHLENPKAEKPPRRDIDRTA